MVGAEAVSTRGRGGGLGGGAGPAGLHEAGRWDDRARGAGLPALAGARGTGGGPGRRMRPWALLRGLQAE